MKTQLFILLFCALNAIKGERFTVIPKFNGQDSAVIVDTDQPAQPKTETLSYYQPIQNQPSYKILHNKGRFENALAASSTTTAMPTATIFTQEEFPRDLLEIAQQKLGLKTLDEVPSVTELAELLGTNSADETISYIRQLTSTDQGIALMKAYIESSDYTDNIGIKQNIISTTTTQKPITAESTQPGLFQRMAAFLNIYNVQPHHKQLMEEQLQKIVTPPQIQPTALKNMRPVYIRNPLPYHYPIPLRPLTVNRTALRKNSRNYIRPPTLPSPTPPHLNTLKSMTPGYIQQLARIANVPPKKLESFLYQKPKLAELASKLASFQPSERNPLADIQLLDAVQKVMEQDEDLKKLLNSSNTLK